MKGITGVRIRVTNLRFSESLLHAVGQAANFEVSQVKKMCPLRFQILTAKLLG
jgi:hypothetical protein